MAQEAVPLVAPSAATDPRAVRAHRFLRALPVIAAGVDLGLVVASMLGAVWLRSTLGFFEPSTPDPASLSQIAPWMVLGWLLSVLMVGGYAREVLDAGTEEFLRVIRGSLLVAAVVGIGCYLVRYPLPRGFYVYTFLVGIPLLVLGRWALRTLVRAARSRGLLLQSVLVAGSRAHVDGMVASLQRTPWLGYDVIGAVTPEYDVAGETPTGIPVLGDTTALAEIAIESKCDIVFVTGGAVASPQQLRELVWSLEGHHVQLLVAPVITDVSSERVRFRPVGGLSLIHVDGPRTHLATRSAKRLFDVVGSLALILAFSPLLAFAALRIKLHDGGPVLFSHQRVGKDGQPFHCLKFRTMVPNAEALVKKLQEQQGASALLFKMKDDPRITKPGSWLRRFSVDELPQLFNVLRGDMSLVGPRPQVQREVELYESQMHRRLRVRPGMTGLWQVSGRNDLSAREAMRLDLYYVDNWSMLQDLSILVRTVTAVFSSRGAY